MQQAELREIMMQRTLSQFEGQFIPKIIQRLLTENHGNCRSAIHAMTEDDSFHLGNFGMYGPDGVHVHCFGYAKTNQIEGWFPTSDFANNPPDLVVTWFEVFEYVKAGCKLTYQMELFT